MILVMDIGNTNMVIGVYEGKNLIVNFRIATEKNKMADDYGIVISNLLQYKGIDIKDIKAVVICSVVPPIMRAIEEMCFKYFNKTPLIINDQIKSSIKILYDDPKEVGADRLVNALAAYELYGKSRAVIVVDFGTATTFDVISTKGEYLGGAIAPGIGISVEALFRQAAKLPRIELVKPKRIIGKNTVESMQAGIIFGFAGKVDEIVRRIKKELNEPVFVVATGGLAELIAPETKTIKYVDLLLTLKGLRIIYEKKFKS